MTDIATEASEIFSVLASAVDLLDPAASAALTTLSKIVAGVIAAEPTAQALFESFQSGTPPTAAQLADYASAYEAAYQKLDKDLSAG